MLSDDDCQVEKKLFGSDSGQDIIMDNQNRHIYDLSHEGCGLSEVNII